DPRLKLCAIRVACDVSNPLIGDNGASRIFGPQKGATEENIVDVKFTGNYGNMTEISYQVAKRAAKKGAKYYHITRQWQERGNNITISADLYK
ncbi:DUF1471 domain-containing protein, partial [Salmonella enterica subsp. enterica serovar Virginia]|nr:DUF1471 domain-containing protein [Salmonella enterica subsp. enterica serovar Virginia]